MELFVAAGPFIFERRNVKIVGDDSVPRRTPTVFNELVLEFFIGKGLNVCFNVVLKRDEGRFEIRIILREKGLFRRFGFGESSDERGVDVVDSSRHNDRISRSLRVVTRGGFMTAVRLASRTFITRAIEHNVAVEMAKLTDIVVVLVARAVCRIKMLFAFVPQCIS